MDRLIHQRAVVGDGLLDRVAIHAMPIHWRDLVFSESAGDDEDRCEVAFLRHQDFIALFPKHLDHSRARLVIAEARDPQVDRERRVAELFKPGSDGGVRVLPQLVGDFQDSVIAGIQTFDEPPQEPSKWQAIQNVFAHMGDHDRVVGNGKELLKMIVDSLDFALIDRGGAAVGGEDHIVRTN